MANGPAANSAPPGSDVSRGTSEATRTSEGATAWARACRCANSHAARATIMLPATTAIISHAPHPEPGGGAGSHRLIASAAAAPLQTIAR